MVKRTFKVKRIGPLIELKPGEADVLSFVAAHATTPKAKPHLIKVLATSTRRARAIGSVLLGESKTPKPAYRVMAQRFADASASNRANARLLTIATPHQFKYSS